MKIAFFTSFAFPQGTYFRWHNLAIGLQNLGHQVTVHAVGSTHPGRTRFEERDGVAYVLVPHTPLLHRLIDYKLDPITLLRAIRHSPEPSDIHHIFQPFPLSCLPGLFHRSRTRRVIFDWDDLWWGGFFPVKKGFPWPATWPQRIAKRLETLMPQKADAVTTCSEFLANAAQLNGAASTQVIHNGFWPSDEVASKTTARDTFGLNPQAFYFGFMGRTTGELEWCLDVLDAQCSHGRETRLALCGMNSSLIDTLPAKHRLRIDYLGNLTPEQTQAFARAIDCGLLPLENSPFNQSRFPIKFAEYLAGGAHVVASSVGEFARLAPLLEGVVLAGTSRSSWKNTLASLNLAELEPQITSDTASALAQKLGWLGLSRQLQDFYVRHLSR